MDQTSNFRIGGVDFSTVLFPSNPHIKCILEDGTPPTLTIRLPGLRHGPLNRYSVGRTSSGEATSGWMRNWSNYQNREGRGRNE